ncbi:MAG: hypothetical protein WCP74_01780 [Sphingobacteriia bacterium]|jgi:hypothetical protein
MLKFVAAFIFSLTCLFTQAQTNIYPGNFRFISVYGPLMNYWIDSATRKECTILLDSILTTKRNWVLNKNNDFQFVAIKNNTSIKSITKYPQLNINFIEYSTPAYIKQFNLEIVDSSFIKEVLSILRLEVRLEDKNQLVIFEKDLDVYVKQGPSNGIGIPINGLHFTKKGMLETLKKSFSILFDSTTTNEAIDLRVAGAFVGDNFILAKTNGLNRTQVSTTKGISKFKYKAQDQLIRWGDQLYKDVVLYGKNKTLIPGTLVKAFENTNGGDNSHPVFLMQEGRDILSNKNYTIQLAAYLGVDAYQYLNFNTVRPVVKLISGYNHFLLNEKDTTAIFEIQMDIVDSTKKIFLNQISNGVDLSSVTSFESLESEIPLTYDYLIKGKLKEISFEIKIAGDRYLREFYLNNELICVANGNIAPERFVMLDNSISPETMNALFIIGFNSFFQ